LLTEIVGDRNVLTGDERENYSRDETPKLKPFLPAVVVKPEDTDSVAKILKLANERKSQSPHNRRCGFVPYPQVLLFGNPPPLSTQKNLRFSWEPALSPSLGKGGGIIYKRGEASLTLSLKKRK